MQIYIYKADTDILVGGKLAHNSEKISSVCFRSFPTRAVHFTILYSVTTILKYS